jgi:hypothetical protein
MRSALLMNAIRRVTISVHAKCRTGLIAVQPWRHAEIPSQSVTISMRYHR